MFEPAERLKNVKVSASAAMTRKVRELRAQGVKIVGLSSGEPDFKSPANAIEAAHQAALAGDTKYPPQDGQLALKKAVQKKFKRDNNLDYALDEIMISNGSKQIMFGATMASVNPGDEVIIPAPGWISYADQVKLCGGVPVSVSCPENNQFRLRAADLDAAITPNTKWVVLNFPNNPTGAVCTREEMKELADVLVQHPHVLVMADEIYEHLVYDGVKAAFHRRGRAQAQGPHADRQRRLEGLCDDRLAGGLCRRPEGDDRGDDEHAGPGDCRRLDDRSGGGARGTRGPAGPDPEPSRRLPEPAQPGGRLAARGQGHHLPQARGRVLRVSQHRRLHRQDDAEAARSWRPTRISSPRCSRNATSPRCRARPTA